MIAAEPPPLPDDRLALLAERLQRRIGIALGPTRHRQLRHALVAVAADLQQPDAAACLEHLLQTPFDRALLGRLAQHITVGETYFLREPTALEPLRREVLPLLAAERGGRLRLWSAGCATGEEAYTLAMLATETLGGGGGIDILGTDIDERALATARLGRYGAWSFRGVPAAQQDRFFRRGDGGGLEVGETLRRRVRFAWLNLADDSYPSASSGTERMDLILCRNVLMYFEPALARRAVIRLASALSEGGWLAVGAAEGTIAQEAGAEAGLTAVPFDAVTLYCKRPPQPPRPSRRAAPIPAPKAAPLPASSPVPTHATPPVPADGPAVAPAPLSLPQAQDRLVAAPADADALLRLAQGQADRGALAIASQWLARALIADRLQPEAHYLDACILAEQGAADAALTALDRALFLAPDFALAHLMRAGLARRHGKPERALASLDTALAILDRRPGIAAGTAAAAGDAAGLAEMARLMRRLTTSPPASR